MINRNPPRAPAPHLFAALIACGLLTVALIAGRHVAIRLAKKTAQVTIPEDFSLKNQGLVFQRVALRTSNVLPLYGSSELTQPVPGMASEIFRAAPTGFQVSPVGTVGTTSLIILQKLGALGSELRDRKIVISLSPNWFYTPVINPGFYAGNFSIVAASNMIFGGSFDFNLKRDIARRMLQFPPTLEKSALLEMALNRYASGSWFDRAVLVILWPLGKVQNSILNLQDHLGALVYMLNAKDPATGRHQRGINSRPPAGRIDSIGATASKMKPDAAEPLDPQRSRGNAAFVDRINAAREWIDLDLLLRGLTELKAQPLITSMPIAGAYYDLTGVSRRARQVYYDRMRELVSRYHVPIVDFQDHDTDTDFLIAHGYHPTTKGWTYYNRALDDFFHADRVDPLLKQ